MSQIRYFHRLKNGRIDRLMMFIRSFTSMPSTILVRDNGVIVKKAAYVILGLTCDGRKEVLSLAIGEHESAKFWLSALNELKNRGVQDIMIICADGLTGIKEALTTAFPKTDYQRCMVHMVRNTLKYVASKDMKSFASDLKTIYNAVSEDEAQKARDRVVEKWSAKYPASMKRWIENWDVVVPIFKFSKDVRKIIYTTNAIESLNSSYRKLEPPAQCVPKQPGAAESFVSCNF